MEALWQDLRYAIRLLRRSPRNSAIAVAILALGIGANTAMFSVVNHVLFRPLPFPDAGRIIRLRDAVTSRDGQLRAFNMASRNVLALRAHTELFDGLVAFSANSMTLLGRDAPERVSVVFQSDGTDETLAIKPIVGRGFTTGEERLGIDSGVALASYALWQSHFGGSPNAIGTTFRLDERQFTLVGVLPQGYAFPYDAQLWIPTTLDSADRAGNFAVFGRMRPGVSMAQVRSALPAVAAHPAAVSGHAGDVRLRRDDDSRERARQSGRPASRAEQHCLLRAADRVRQCRDAAPRALRRAPPRVRDSRDPRRQLGPPSATASR